MYNDNLIMVNTKRVCPYCKNERVPTKTCKHCKHTGFDLVDISRTWSPASGFLVCGGPSLKKIPYQRLSERGIVSLGINNVSGLVPVSAWVYSDPQEKFHHGLFLDPNVITFTPTAKLNKKIRIKENGQFIETNIKVKDCPNTFGFERKTSLYPEGFLTTDYAMWGYGGKQPEETRPFTCLATMLLGLRLMCYMGCQQIFIIGADFWRAEDDQYAFSQKASLANSRYVKENDMLKSVRPAIEAAGVKVYNCNPESKCDAFEFVSFDDAMIQCKARVPEEPFDLAGWYEKNKEEEAARKKRDNRKK